MLQVGQDGLGWFTVALDELGCVKVLEEAQGCFKWVRFDLDCIREALSGQVSLGQLGQFRVDLCCLWGIKESQGEFEWFDKVKVG